MTVENTGADDGGFEQRAQALLQDSADRLSGTVRSRLTQARYAALAAQRAPYTAMTRRWMPAGALAAAVLVALVVFVPRVRPPVESPVANPGLEDIELLSDSESVPLNDDQDVDYDFYEWAAGEASGTPSSSVGT